MNTDFNANPVSTMNEPPKKSNTTLIIIIIVVVIMLCCCCIASVLAWNYGDALLTWLNI